MLRTWQILWLLMEKTCCHSLQLRFWAVGKHRHVEDGAAMWCMGFVKVSNKGATILGDLVLKDKISVYDLAHQRIGWQTMSVSQPFPSTCFSILKRLITKSTLEI